tara:strand:+ start:260 stop:511 length:252 start_codon:yes stop_codon:yes gene_type:complete
MRSAAYRREKVAGQTHMQHLFDGDVQDCPAPPLHAVQLLLGNTFLNTLFHAEGAEQVAAHDSMFKLGSFRQHVNQLPSVLYPD